MGRKPINRDRKRFVTGRADAWSTGGHGATVKLFAKAGKLKISWQNPVSKKSKQKTLFSADSQELRERAARYAVTHSEKLRAGEIGSEEARVLPTVDELTIFDVCLLYMERIPGFPASLLDETEAKVEAWHAALPEAVRASETTPSAGTVSKDVRSFQHLWRATYEERGRVVQPFARTRKVSEIEPGDSTKLMAADVARGRSPRTVANEHDRLSAAFRYVVRQHRRSVGLLYNPIDGRIADRTKARIPRYTPEEIQKLLAKAREWLRKGRRWQLFVALGLSSSGRRVQSLLGLTAADHDFEANTVLWRAKYAKGENYGRGDSLRPMTSLHRSAALWAIQNRPNPVGPEAPLLWGRRSKGEPMDRESIRAYLHELEAEACVATIRGRAIHSMRRAVVTLLADAMGDGKAAEFVDMTVRTVRAHDYKQVQMDVQEASARALDDLLPDAEEEGE